jgi:hypothetical protein
MEDGRVQTLSNKVKPMKKMSAVLAVAALLGILAVPSVLGQRGPIWRGSAGWNTGSQYNRLYDTKTVETVSGEIVSVDHIIPVKGMGQGVHVQLKTDKETVSVHLGPAWFLENQDVKIEPKDKVEIKGSRIKYDGKPAIIAAEVKKGDVVLKLRDENGIPIWAGWRRR